MDFDVFFSISQTPVDGFMPSEREMFENFFQQVEAADRLGFGVAWIAESHFSSQTQKSHAQPVVPHWEGEIGLNVDWLHLAHAIFARTERIEVGAAIMNILCNGGPIPAAEKLCYFLALHGLDPSEARRVHAGFAAGRFDFMNRVTGVVPRNAAEEAAGRVWKGKIFEQAAEIFVRLVQGETLDSSMLSETSFTRADFRSDEDWAKVQQAAGTTDDVVPVPPFWQFEATRIIPADVRRELVQLIIGSHDPKVQEKVNAWAPVQVFNLSITKPEIIDDTHRRMSAAYHADGGAWRRQYMPRTVFVFLNEEAGLTPEQRRDAARQEALAANEAYFKALTGTIDPSRIANAADNALVGTAEDVAAQILERFHPEDRLMLWFDFFNHDSDRVVRNMEAFMEKVAPIVRGGLQ
ncbi:MAG: LLM class flavin-dependent oxidoreductase [Deltaproteobacteria bacterium]|nr:MAG: LLM class flavin-dependent oxidoreductase [Deltaproteobacteria bacterium]